MVTAPLPYTSLHATRAYIRATPLGEGEPAPTCMFHAEGVLSALSGLPIVGLDERTAIAAWLTWDASITTTAFASDSPEAVVLAHRMAAEIRAQRRDLANVEIKANQDAVGWMPAVHRAARRITRVTGSHITLEGATLRAGWQRLAERILLAVDPIDAQDYIVANVVGRPESYRVFYTGRAYGATSVTALSGRTAGAVIETADARLGQHYEAVHAAAVRCLPTGDPTHVDA